MAFDEALADRVREIISVRADVREKRMFGGVGWMIGGNMACGVIGDELIVRFEKEDTQRVLADPATRPFEGNGRVMSGFALVDGDALAEDAALAGWVDFGADYAASLPSK